MPSTANLLVVENGREAGIVGVVASLVDGTVVTALGSGIGNAGLAVGGLTALLLFVVLVALNLAQRCPPEVLESPEDHQPLSMQECTDEQFTFGCGFEFEVSEPD